MKRFLLATLSMVALTSVTRAADMPAVMPTKGAMYSLVSVTNWEGFYVGVQGGVVRRNTLFTRSSGTATLNFQDDESGGAAGALLGYNLQHGNLVFGVEGDWSWLSTKATHDPQELIGTFDARWLATIRGRVGFTFDSVLVYITGGAAFAKVADHVPLLVTTDGIELSAFDVNQTKTGWTLGGGVEYMFAPRWTVRAEFRYVDIGTMSVACNVTGNFADACSGGLSRYRGELSNTLKLGLVGLAYKF